MGVKTFSTGKNQVTGGDTRMRPGLSFFAIRSGCLVGLATMPENQIEYDNTSYLKRNPKNLNQIFDFKTGGTVALVLSPIKSALQILRTPL